VAPAESRGIGDLHSHLVPAVDDGACSLEEALDAVERMVERGVRSIVTTPHLNASTTKVASDREARLAEVDEAWNEVCGAVKVRFPTLGFRRGHEVMLDIPDPDLSDPRVRLSGTSFVLVEWPRLQIPPQTEPVLERICAEGYRPIIAHPERYRGMAQTIDLAGAWRRAGAFLQVNNGSLAGRYGDEARDVAFALLARGLVDYFSSDFHARAHLRTYLKYVTTFLEEQAASEQLELLTVTNPARVLDDEMPLPVPIVEMRSGLWSRVKAIFGG
jgi:protein-tyrosine phosphatase